MIHILISLSCLPILVLLLYLRLRPYPFSPPLWLEWNEIFRIVDEGPRKPSVNVYSNFTLPVVPKLFGLLVFSTFPVGVPTAVNPCLTFYGQSSREPVTLVNRQPTKLFYLKFRESRNSRTQSHYSINSYRFSVYLFWQGDVCVYGIHGSTFVVRSVINPFDCFVFITYLRLIFNRYELKSVHFIFLVCFNEDFRR